MNAGDGNAFVIQQLWRFFHHYCGCYSTYLRQEVKCISLMYYAHSKKKLPSVVSMSNFVRQNILNGRNLFVASNRLECKFLVLAVRALALAK